ncbi:hypothetical protein RJT34_05055 [Clitoria ternatea]|uniref:Uncharacterized protein n=1 Tax=Clitoria ternatea TaxID=43366 RepID=A0AAN9K2N6_CLITE
MIKRSPSRNHRSKGFKVRHVLQIILLLGICFWLIYQVKRSHDKKKEFAENDAKVSVGTQTPKLGRKDLHPGKDQVNQNEKLEEEEEDENIVNDEDKHEHEGIVHESDEKDDKLEMGGGEEQEEDENKSNEVEDERAGGDDEIDENDREQSALDTDGDEFLDQEEDKEEESDEKENKNSENEEKDSSVKNHNSHEAREEQYKADDASSAVTHDTLATSTETETVVLENSDVNSEMNITKSESIPNYTVENNRNQYGSNFNITEVELTGRTSSNATSGKEIGSNSLSDAVDSSHQNNITTTYSDSHSEVGSNLTVVIPGGGNNMTGTSSAITSSEQIKKVIFSESDQVQNGTVDTTVTGDVKNVQTEGIQQGGKRVSEENLRGSNLTVPVKTETRDTTAGESSNRDGGESEKTRFVASNETERNNGVTETSEANKTQNISQMNENTDATKDEEFKGDRQTDETPDTSDSGKHHDTDSPDSHILKDVAEVRTDLYTLPEIRNEGDNGHATATE